MPPIVLTEAVLIAFAKATEAIANAVTEGLKKQTPEQAQQLLDWWIADIRWWRKLVGLPE